jgi:hypothetical protein
MTGTPVSQKIGQQPVNLVCSGLKAEIGFGAVRVSLRVWWIFLSEVDLAS